MKIFDIMLDEYGQATCRDGKGNNLFLQMPITPESQNTINGKPLDTATAKEYAKVIDEHFGKGDTTLARLCYAGGQVYNSYTLVDGVYITDNGDEFVAHPYSDIYNVECYIRK